MKEELQTRSDVIIEGHQARFQLAAQGEINGTYSGEFVFRCYMSPSQQIAANRDMREMLGTNPTLADEHISFLAYALSQLKYRIISAPPFWAATKQINGLEGDLVDEEIITQVLDAAIHAQLKYKSEINKRKLELIEKARKAAEKMLDSQVSDDEDEDDDFDDEDDKK